MKCKYQHLQLCNHSIWWLQQNKQYFLLQYKWGQCRMGVQPAALQWLLGIQFRIYGSSNWDSFWDLKGNILNFILSGLHNPSPSRGPSTDYVMVGKMQPATAGCWHVGLVSDLCWPCSCVQTVSRQSLVQTYRDEKWNVFGCLRGCFYLLPYITSFGYTYVSLEFPAFIIHWKCKVNAILHQTILNNLYLLHLLTTLCTKLLTALAKVIKVFAVPRKK